MRAQVQADVRTIRSRNFASRHSLRFPRVHRVRWDKAPTDIQTDAQLWAVVEANKGAIVGAPHLPLALHDWPGDLPKTCSLLPGARASPGHLLWSMATAMLSNAVSVVAGIGS